jgi:hypothetical protein
MYRFSTKFNGKLMVNGKFIGNVIVFTLRNN